MLPEGECVTYKNDSKIKVEEGARKVLFCNPTRESYTVIEFDGCLVKNATASDFVISHEHKGDLVVELKGKDVAHGCHQVQVTAEYLLAKGISSNRIAGLVVCRQYPKHDTKVQRAALAFARRHRGPLHIVAHNCEILFDDVFAFGCLSCTPVK